MVNALNCEAFNPQFWGVSKSALSRLTTCSDPVGIVDGGGVLFMSLKI